MKKTNIGKAKTKDMFKKACPHCESILQEVEVVTGYDKTAWDLWCELCDKFFCFVEGD
jgi:hypothetical protein